MNCKKRTSSLAFKDFLNVSLLVFCLLVNFTNTAAQTEEEWDYPEHDRQMRTFADGDVDIGFYWGLDFRAGLTSQSENAIFLAGGKAAWVINHSLGLGFAGYGFYTEYSDLNLFNNNFILYGGYGGFFAEPVLGPDFPVHLAFPMLIGAGSVEFDDEQFFYNLELFLVAEPGVTVEFSVTPFLRMGFTGTYRFTSVIKTEFLDKNFLNGWSAGFSIKFGRF